MIFVIRGWLGLMALGLLLAVRLVTNSDGHTCRLLR